MGFGWWDGERLITVARTEVPVKSCSGWERSLEIIGVTGPLFICAVTSVYSEA